MKKVSTENLKRVAPLFEGWEHTAIWSGLDGSMGEVWADNAETPLVAKIMMGETCYFAGDARLDIAKDLVKHVPETYSYEEMHLIGIDEHWNKLFEKLFENPDPEYYETYSRYAFRKTSNQFNKAKLQKFVDSLPDGYEIVQLDEHLLREIQQLERFSHHGGNFPDFSTFQNYGIGFAVLHQEKVVCVASSYTFYNGGIDIQVDTDEDYQRMGLATACAARLILGCLERGIFPSWDADCLESVALAEKLGYCLDKEYSAYGIAI